MNDDGFGSSCGTLGHVHHIHQFDYRQYLSVIFVMVCQCIRLRFLDDLTLISMDIIRQSSGQMVMIIDIVIEVHV